MREGVLGFVDLVSTGGRYGSCRSTWLVSVFKGEKRGPPTEKAFLDIAFAAVKPSGDPLSWRAAIGSIREGRPEKSETVRTRSTRGAALLEWNTVRVWIGAKMNLNGECRFIQDRERYLIRSPVLR